MIPSVLPVLEATGVVKAYGAVVALRGASIAVRPGEVHALLGANGAGKSTLVKILTGAVRPDAGTIKMRGQIRSVHSPKEARRSGLISVYQEPALIPDLDVGDNLRLTDTPVEPFRAWLRELGVGEVDRSAYIRELPLVTLRVMDLARALAADPDVLLLDEMTAALPADLTERVLEVLRQRRDSGRSVVFISHRLFEISSLCDRATVLRDGETVGVVDMDADAPARIVELMLPPAEIGTLPQPSALPTDVNERLTASRSTAVPRLEVNDLRVGTRLNGVSFSLYPGEILGVVALEGQGQDQLFEVLAGERRPDAGELRVDGHTLSFRHPADAIAAGLVYVPANRTDALLMQRSVRENIALPFSARPRHWGLIDVTSEGHLVSDAIDRLQIDTRAQAEVRRLSGGNQQKVTIARWVANGVRTLLCFDPTRGIDIRTKREIYQLVRDLAADGAAILLYTSELEEIRVACERVIVLFGGRLVDELAAADADEPTLVRAAYGLTATGSAPAHGGPVSV